MKAKFPKGVEIVGIGAGRFHSILFTNSAVYSFGLNAGQLGELRYSDILELNAAWSHL
jgi:hypothetical protein